MSNIDRQMAACQRHVSTRGAVLCCQPPMGEHLEASLSTRLRRGDADRGGRDPASHIGTTRLRGASAVLFGATLAFLAGCSASQCPGEPPSAAAPCPQLRAYTPGVHRLDRDPSWRPGGERMVAYVHGAVSFEDAERNGPVQIWTLDLETQVRRYLSDGHAVAWAPDGGSLLVIRERAGSFHAWRWGLDSAVREQLTPDSVRVINGSWSPDGSRVAVQVVDRVGTFISVLEVSSGSLSPIALGITPRWSPDGKWIAHGPGARLVSPTDPDSQVVLMDGEGFHPLGWSRDGSALFVAAQDGRVGSCFRVNVRTGEHEVVLAGITDVAWAPGEGEAVFSAVVDRSGELVLLHLDSTGSCRQLTSSADYLTSGTPRSPGVEAE